MRKDQWGERKAGFFHSSFISPHSSFPLTLLGTVHGDPEGFMRAIGFFEQQKPDLILIELSPFARVFRKRHLHSFRRTLYSNIREAAGLCGISFREALRHPEVRAVGRQISYPFEYRAAAVYAKKAPTRLLLVDYSPFSMKWILTWPELISTENLLTLVSIGYRSLSVRDTYETAENRIRGHTRLDRPSPAVKDTDPLWEARERFMAREIRRALYVLKPLRPVYIGGWWHLTAGGETATLRELLDVEVHQCRLLDGRM